MEDIVATFQGIPLLGHAIRYGYNFTINLWRAFAVMEPQNYIRLIAVVGAYLLIRPWLMKFGEKMQTKEHEKAFPSEDLAPKAKVTPNMLRGDNGKEVEIAEGSEGEAETTGANWGKKARNRQRAYDKKLLAEAEERRRQLQEDDEDKDIEQFLIDGKDIREHLVDYTPGEDGW